MRQVLKNLADAVAFRNKLCSIRAGGGWRSIRWDGKFIIIRFSNAGGKDRQRYMELPDSKTAFFISYPTALFVSAYEETGSFGNFCFRHWRCLYRPRSRCVRISDALAFGKNDSLIFLCPLRNGLRRLCPLRTQPGVPIYFGYSIGKELSAGALTRSCDLCLSIEERRPDQGRP
jgi:hypothetical protein